MIYLYQLPFHVYVPFIKQFEPGIVISMYCDNLQSLVNEFFKNYTDIVYISYQLHTYCITIMYVRSQLQRHSITFSNRR